MTITRQAARDLTTEIIEAITPIVARHGMVLGPPSTSYGIGYALKLKADPDQTNPDTGVNEASEYAQAFKMLHRSYGLNENALGVHFTTRHGTFRFDGINARAQKWPFIGTELSTGRTFKFAAGSTEAINAACTPKE